MDSPPAQTVARLAPAKINLALHVTGRRADGYHLHRKPGRLHPLRRPRRPSPASDEDGFAVSGPFAAACAARRRQSGAARPRRAAQPPFPTAPARRSSIALEKNLPVASGIGGGSSDAAATLRALADLWAIDRRCRPCPHRACARRRPADVPCRAAADRARASASDRSVLPNFPALAPGAGQSRRRGLDARPCSRRWHNATTNPGCRRLPLAIDFAFAAQLAGDRPATTSSRRHARSSRPSLRRLTALDRAGSRLRPHVGLRRDLLRPVRDRQRRPSAPPPPSARRQPGWFVVATRSMASEADAAWRDESRALHPGRHRRAHRVRHAHAGRRQVRPDARRPHRRGRPCARRPRHRHRRQGKDPRTGAGVVAGRRRSTWSSPPAAPASPAAT